MEIETDHGHDGFLIESAKITAVIRNFCFQTELEEKSGSADQEEPDLVELSLN